jgi:hypothetical protein
MVEHTGWLLDVYPGAPDGLVLWLLCQRQDGSVYRLRLHQKFPITFYAAGPSQQLRSLWRFLESQPEQIKLYRTERRDLFQVNPLAVLAIEVAQPAAQPRLFQKVSRAFPQLNYYDADLHVALRYAARFGAFPLAHCRIEIDHKSIINQIDVLADAHPGTGG